MTTGLEKIAAPLQRTKLSLPCKRIKQYALCCEPFSEERSAGNPHAAFCGSWRWVTAAGDPVPHLRRTLLQPFEAFLVFEMPVS